MLNGDAEAVVVFFFLEGFSAKTWAHILLSKSREYILLLSPSPYADILYTVQEVLSLYIMSMNPL